MMSQKWLLREPLIHRRTYSYYPFFAAFCCFHSTFSAAFIRPLFSKTFSSSVNERRASTTILEAKTSDDIKIVWMRDFALRIHENEALYTAVERISQHDIGSKILPIYLVPPSIKNGGTAGDVFIAQVLKSLDEENNFNGNLMLLPYENDDMINVLSKLAAEVDAKEVYYLESFDSLQEEKIQHDLQQCNLVPKHFSGSFSLLPYNQKEEVTNLMKQVIQDHPFNSPLIPFCSHVADTLKSQDMKKPLPKHEKLSNVLYDTTELKRKLHSLSIQEYIDTLGKTNQTEWGKSIIDVWPASEKKAVEALNCYLASTKMGDLDKSKSKSQHFYSRISPYLARGVISVNQVYNAAHSQIDENNQQKSVDDAFLRRIGWREYTYALTSLFPDVLEGNPIRDGYYMFHSEDTSIQGEDKDEEDLFLKWKEGKTGYPLVDSGMRQLIKEGWMPQVVRLASSACLVEGLGISWEKGMQHFEEYLVDYDAAINTNMWMNAGGVGFDPYYIGMNYRKRKYWDVDGNYVRHWCPELKDLPDDFNVPVDSNKGQRSVDCLYQPWEAPDDILKQSNVELGVTYPHRICDDREKRRRFFADLRTVRSKWPDSMIDPSTGCDIVPIGRQDCAPRVPMFTPRALLSKRF